MDLDQPRVCGVRMCSQEYCVQRAAKGVVRQSINFATRASKCDSQILKADHPK